MDAETSVNVFETSSCNLVANHSDQIHLLIHSIMVRIQVYTTIIFSSGISTNHENNSTSMLPLKFFGTGLIIQTILL